MKTWRQSLPVAVLLAALQFALHGCVATGGYAGEDDVYYGTEYTEPWFFGGVWLDGRHRDRDHDHDRDRDHHRGSGDAYISPPRYRAAPPHPKAAPRPPEPARTSKPSKSDHPTRDHREDKQR